MAKLPNPPKVKAQPPRTKAQEAESKKDEARAARTFAEWRTLPGNYNYSAKFAKNNPNTAKAALADVARSAKAAAAKKK